ncbi:hypothetical protein HOD96_00095 [Candidatus Falkowbacteria bacterium]|jgi:hypothetical protein|nr:hypothetical protein [Candidatus Falkowbacteria bacterium]MBT4432810.1 hypothetical protein [Candidatus Falkowbacteria bacterium]
MEKELREFLTTLPWREENNFNAHNSWCMLHQFKPIAMFVFEFANINKINSIKVRVNFETIKTSFTVEYMRYTNGMGSCMIARKNVGSKLPVGDYASIREDKVSDMTGHEHSDAYFQSKLDDVARKWRR